MPQPSPAPAHPHRPVVRLPRPPGRLGRPPDRAAGRVAYPLDDRRWPLAALAHHGTGQGWTRCRDSKRSSSLEGPRRRNPRMPCPASLGQPLCDSLASSTSRSRVRQRSIGVARTVFGFSRAFLAEHFPVETDSWRGAFKVALSVQGNEAVVLHCRDFQRETQRENFGKSQSLGRACISPLKAIFHGPHTSFPHSLSDPLSFRSCCCFSVPTLVRVYTPRRLPPQAARL